MKKALLLPTIVVVASAFAAGCAAVEHTSSALAPSATPATWYVGTWVSSTVSGPPAAGTCGNFEWRVTQQTATVMSGLFTAQCGGNLKMSGSAWGQLNGTTVPVTITVGGTGPGNPSCDTSMASTATIEGDTIRLPYSGTTCLGPISGTEVLRRR